MRPVPIILAGLACLLLVPGSWAQSNEPDATRPPPRDTGLQFDVAENVPVEEADAIRYGFGAAQDFLNEDLGGDVPANVRAGITTKIVATGRGNEEPGGGGACCTASSNGQPRPFFDVQHPDWMHEFSFGLPGARDEKIAAHEYTHVWQMHVGCVQNDEHPIAAWIIEGTAERVAYLATAAAGRISAQDASLAMQVSHDDAQWQRPLSDFGQNTGPAWPGNIGAVALGVALEGRTDGLLPLRQFCEAIESGNQQEAAFESAFGISLATFYDRFESWKQTQSLFGVQWDVGPGVTEAELQPIRSGLVLGQEFLQGHAGGGVPLADRTGLVVRVVASGSGHEGACCTAGLGGNIVPGADLAFFIDVRHPHWTNRAFSHDANVERTTTAGQLQTTVHEYTHVWQANLGCNENLPKWAVEGMAEQTSYEAIVGVGQMSRDIVYPFVLSIAQDQEWAQPLPSYSTDAPAWPGDIGWLALERARGGAGQATFRTLCEMVGEGRSVEEAFQAAFGQSLDSFYTEFQAWKDTNPQVVWPSRSEQTSPSPVTSPAASPSPSGNPQDPSAEQPADPSQATHPQPDPRATPLPLLIAIVAIGLAATFRRHG